MPLKWPCHRDIKKQLKPEENTTRRRHGDDTDDRADFLLTTESPEMRMEICGWSSEDKKTLRRGERTVGGGRNFLVADGAKTFLSFPHFSTCLAGFYWSLWILVLVEKDSFKNQHCGGVASYDYHHGNLCLAELKTARRPHFFVNLSSNCWEKVSSRRGNV